MQYTPVEILVSKVFNYIQHMCAEILPLGRNC
jgi:hypothetical protein